MSKIGVIDLGIGNFANVCRALDGEMCSDPQSINRYSSLVLPGVGSFDGIAGKIEDYREEILRFIRSGRKFLGICLGMQLLFEGSEEGEKEGLGIFKGKIIRFKEVQTPHMGWNLVQFKDAVFESTLGADPYFYFVHSYYLPEKGEDFEAAYTEHIGKKKIRFCSAVKKDNIWGVQFHPEKSGETGKKFLEVFKKGKNL
ncbi:MAG TPA: imidazole glycerol phosphate synthase subunit HisH [Thermotogota bacterium]|nr:imidazole glycerol phosphate synthase subunit HisH [Thermotogota bacterium]HPJ89815.1 imidazole glycerol phosphate synthase subunit HisH [Thermotogota bacterium]HPR96972.1 imidazole glycerol phosphate synthase subunit HisH [Thermotogota bacterium]